MYIGSINSFNLPRNIAQTEDSLYKYQEDLQELIQLSNDVNEQKYEVI